jgi:hypothetical protein
LNMRHVCFPLEFQFKRYDREESSFPSVFKYQSFVSRIKLFSETKHLKISPQF